MMEAETTQLWQEFKFQPNPELKKKIILNYLRLVHYVIHNSKFARIDVLEERDYFQFGIEGLSEAIDRFDPDYGTKFETYAIQRIRGKILDELRKVQKKIKHNDSLEVQRIVNYSLDSSPEDDNGYTFTESVKSDYDLPNEEYEKNESIRILNEEITKLNERDRVILGLYYYEHLNYQEISQILNITVSRVSQVHSKIIKTLKNKLAYLNV